MLRLFSLMPLSQKCDEVSVKRDAFLATVSCLKPLIEVWRCFPETWGCCSYALIYGFSSRSSCLSTTFISSTSLSALPDFKHFTSLFSALFLHFASCISFWGMPPGPYPVELFPGVSAMSVCDEGVLKCWHGGRWRFKHKWAFLLSWWKRRHPQKYTRGTNRNLNWEGNLGNRNMETERCMRKSDVFEQVKRHDNQAINQSPIFSISTVYKKENPKEEALTSTFTHSLTLPACTAERKGDGVTAAWNFLNNASPSETFCPERSSDRCN